MGYPDSGEGLHCKCDLFFYTSSTKGMCGKADWLNSAKPFLGFWEITPESTKTWKPNNSIKPRGSHSRIYSHKAGICCSFDNDKPRECQRTFAQKIRKQRKKNQIFFPDIYPTAGQKQGPQRLQLIKTQPHFNYFGISVFALGRNSNPWFIQSRFLCQTSAGQLGKGGVGAQKILVWFFFCTAGK